MVQTINLKYKTRRILNRKKKKEELINTITIELK
jgi:hypothetical protein